MNAKIIAVSSGKGGVGKTTVAAAVSQALAKRGKSVLAIDGDLDFRNLDLVIGLPNSFNYDLGDVADGVCELGDAIYRSSFYPNLYFMAGTIEGDTLKKVDKEVMKKLLDHLRPHFDYIIIDTAAGMGNSFEFYTANADTVLIVTTLYKPAIRDGEKIAEMIARGGTQSYLIVNNVDEDMINSGNAPNIDEIIDRVSVKLIGLLPTEKMLMKWQNRGEGLINHQSEVKVQIEDIAGRLEGENIPLKKFWKN